jgi:hypothetical protein
MFLLWKKRRVDGGTGRCLRCDHEASERFLVRPVIVESYRSDRGPTRRYVWAIGPGIRTCCIDDPHQRLVFWAGVHEHVAYLDAEVPDEGDRVAIRSKLAEFTKELERVVPTNWSRAGADDGSHGARPDTAGRAPPHVPPCFAVLGLTPPATKENVMRAYRRKAFEAHPDRGGSHADFVAIGIAKEQALRLAT